MHGMSSLTVVGHFHVLGNLTSGLITSFVPPVIDLLTLERTPETPCDEAAPALDAWLRSPSRVALVSSGV